MRNTTIPPSTSHSCAPNQPMTLPLLLAGGGSATDDDVVVSFSGGAVVVVAVDVGTTVVVASVGGGAVVVVVVDVDADVGGAVLRVVEGGTVVDGAVVDVGGTLVVLVLAFGLPVVGILGGPTWTVISPPTGAFFGRVCPRNAVVAKPSSTSTMMRVFFVLPLLESLVEPNEGSFQECGFLRRLPQATASCPKTGAYDPGGISKDTNSIF